MSRVRTFLVYYKINGDESIIEGNKFYYASTLRENEIVELKDDLAKSHNADIDSILIMNIMRLDD